jgi:hypothetical protein
MLSQCIWEELIFFRSCAANMRVEQRRRSELRATGKKENPEAQGVRNACATRATQHVE